MILNTLALTYDYAPYRSQDDKEIPAFEILNEAGDKVADTNEDQSAEFQEAIAALFATSPELLEVLEAAGKVYWVHNAAITDDIEALRRICLQYSNWWNHKALPAIARARGKPYDT